MESWPMVGSLLKEGVNQRWSKLTIKALDKSSRTGLIGIL
jgi:hypothetical protein